MSKTDPTQDPTPASNGRRTSAAVRLEFDAARAEYARLQRVCEAHYQSREAALNRVAAAKKIHESNPQYLGIPFDPAIYGPTLAVPPVETDDTIAYHKVHERLTRLENELTAARRAEVTA